MFRSRKSKSQNVNLFVKVLPVSWFQLNQYEVNRWFWLMTYASHLWLGVYFTSFGIYFSSYLKVFFFLSSFWGKKKEKDEKRSKTFADLKSRFFLLSRWVQNFWYREFPLSNQYSNKEEGGLLKKLKISTLPPKSSRSGVTIHCTPKSWLIVKC